MSTTADKKDTGVWGETCPVALFRERKPDWNAFADASVPGYRRAQHRFIGTGASGKADPLSIPPGNFTLSIMYVPVGEGNAPHTHEVEGGLLRPAGTYAGVLGRRERAAPRDTAGSLGLCAVPSERGAWLPQRQPGACYMQVMLGKPTPDLMTYSDSSLQEQRDAHLRP